MAMTVQENAKTAALIEKPALDLTTITALSVVTRWRRRWEMYAAAL